MELPFVSSDQGNQFPFISWAKRIAIGRCRSRTAVANRSMYASWLPSMIEASVYPAATVLSLSGPTGWTVGRGSQDRTGSALRRQVSVTCSAG